MIRRLTAPLVALAVLVLAFTAAPAAEWDIQAAVAAGYVAQTVEEDGEEQTEWNPTVLSGIQFWRAGSIYGFTLGAATLPDEEQKTPRIAPCAAINLGTAGAQFFAAGCADSQNGGDNGLVGAFGFTAAF